MAEHGVRAPGLAEPFVLGHRPALDGVRGLAVLAVVGVHGVPQFVRGGNVGVDVFFVLSGFLITALLLEEHRTAGSIDLRAFYLRRALRLLPALAALLLTCCLGAWAFSPRGEARAMRADAWSVLLYCYNWNVLFRPAAAHPYPLAHLWSLSVEEQFYLLWPMMLSALLALKVRRRWVLALALLGVAAPAVGRVALWNGLSGVTRLYEGTDTHADGLFTGCVLALAAFRGVAPRSPLARGLLRPAAWAALLVLAGHCLLAPVAASRYLFFGGFSVVNLCAAVLIAALIWAPPPLLAWCLQRRWLRWVGRVSYGLYLWHFPIFYLANTWVTGVRSRIKMPIALGVAVAVAALSFYCLEQPLLRLKRRLARGRVRPAEALPPAPGRAA